MIYREFNIVFHLYTVLDHLDHPGMSEFNEIDSILASSYIQSYTEHCFYGIFDANKKMKIIDDTVATNPLHFSGTFTDGQYTISICTKVDCKPWPKIDSKIYKTSQLYTLSGEPYQQWWVHHITMPDNSIIDGDQIPFDINREMSQFAKNFMLDMMEESS